jgi:hypothetical protein
LELGEHLVAWFSVPKASNVVEARAMDKIEVFKQEFPDFVISELHSDGHVKI